VAKSKTRKSRGKVQRGRSPRSRPAPADSIHPAVSIVFILIGAAVLVAGVISLIKLATIVYGGGDPQELLPSMSDETPAAAVPAGAFLVGGAFLFIGVMLVMSARESLTTVAGNRQSRGLAMRTPPTRVGFVLAWMLVPLAAWFACVILPQLLVGAVPNEDAFVLSLVYGFIFAGFVGIFLASLLKRAAHRRRPVPGVSQREKNFWRVASGQWRIESWLAFVAAGLLGVGPLFWIPNDASGSPEAGFFIVAGAIGVAAAAGAAVCAWLSPRSGLGAGFSESVNLPYGG
jgi:hypothetical protein